MFTPPMRMVVNVDPDDKQSLFQASGHAFFIFDGDTKLNNVL